ncbi:MAG: lipolytic protein family [Frankiales bacterium]|nr:lipolytic protein family [Frankiales bacterium]
MSTVRVEPARDETCRQVLRSTSAGSRVRFRLSNAMSSTPLTLTAITAAVRTHGAAIAAPEQVQVGGEPSVTIAPHAQVTTDPVARSVAAGTDIAVTFAVGGTARLSEHLVGAATGWCTDPAAGDHTNDTAAGAFRRPSREALVLESLEVETADTARPGILAVGDSLTDPPLPPDTYQRWTDVLAARTGRPVANAGIGGNRVVLSGGYGPTLVERFGRDILNRPGAGTVVLLTGTNDVSAGITSAALITRLSEVCRAAHRTGLRVVLLTLAPAWHRPAPEEAVRQAVNAWLRTTAEADIRVDADRLLRDPRHPTHLLAAYDLGDGLHLSAAGHRAVGEAVATVVQ